MEFIYLQQMISPKKIFFLLHLPPPVHGSSVVGLSIKESVLINNTFECIYLNILSSNKVAESGNINLSKLYGFFKTWIKLLKMLIINKPDLCYLALTTTGIGFFKDILLIALIRAFKIKRVYHIHNKGVDLYKYKKIYRYGYNFIFKNAEVVLLSQRLYNDLHSFVKETKVHVCPNGLADIVLYPQKKTSENNSFLFGYTVKNYTKKVHILFLSNLIESKGVYILLKACEVLKKNHLNFQCTFAGGEGDISEELLRAKIRELNLDDFVHYVGKKYGKEKEETYKEADIFVLPTCSDCFPLVLIEAMQYSIPVLSTFEGGIPDIVEDEVTGFLVAQNDVHHLTEKLTVLIQNSRLRQQMGSDGRKKYEKHFTLEKFENNLTKILQRLIDQ